MDSAASPSLLKTVHTYHQYLEELLHLHQEALVERDMELALGFWQLHAQMLRLHIQMEEELLLLALERVVTAPAWRADIYRLEHVKVLDLADKLDRLLGQLRHTRPDRRTLIELLDKQRSYKNVLEHHEEREEKGMLPELDAALSAAELVQINKVCAESWQALFQQQLVVVTGLTGRLDAYG
jgi:hypothetical protein